MEISIPDFYSRFLETQDFMFPTFIQKIATLTENRFGKKILSSIRLDDISKSLQVFVKFLWIFRASNVLFLCFGKARETSENVNNFVEYIFFGFSGFLLAQKKNTFSPGKCVKSFQICRDFRKRPLSLKKSTFFTNDAFFCKSHSMEHFITL